jgi:hypothetical protein
VENQSSLRWKMKETGSPKLLFEMLDLSPIRPVLLWGLHTDGPGRPVEYNPEWDLRALMLRQLEQIPYVKDLVKRLRRNRYLRQVCGYQSKVPTEAHFSQMKKRVGHAGFKAVESFLRARANQLRLQQPLSAAGLVQAACLDGTDLHAWSSRDPHDTRRGFGDCEARVGRGPEGFYLGYRSLFLVDMEGFPLGHVEASANRNEKMLVKRLLEDVLGEDFEVELLAGDSQFESEKVFMMLEQRKIDSLICWRRLHGRVNPPDVLTVKNRILVEGPDHKRVMFGRLRARVESFISTLKNHLAYGRFTWKGLGNASIHTSLAFCVVYAVAIAALKLERPHLTCSIAYFA